MQLQMRKLRPEGSLACLRHTNTRQRLVPKGKTLRPKAWKRNPKKSPKPKKHIILLIWVTALSPNQIWKPTRNFYTGLFWAALFVLCKWQPVWGSLLNKWTPAYPQNPGRCSACHHYSLCHAGVDNTPSGPLPAPYCYCSVSQVSFSF